MDASMLYWLGVFIQLANGGFELKKVLYKNVNDDFADRKTVMMNRLLGHKEDKFGSFTVPEGELFIMYDDMDVCPASAL